MNDWYGYLHTNGTVHIKRFFPGDEAAIESPFVEEIFGPVKADNVEIARQKLGFGEKKPRFKLKFGE